MRGSVLKYYAPILATSIVFGAYPSLAAGESMAGGLTSEQMMHRMETMEKRVRMLEQQLAERDRQPAVVGRKHPRKSAKVAIAPEPQDVDPIGLAAPSAPKPILGLAASPVPGLALGAYGELKFGAHQNPDAGGRFQNGFDAARFVLLPTYAITDNIVFNAEIEFEHAGIAFDADDKLHGTAEIEQAYIDFLINEHFNIRAPGIDLVPLGFINLHHEPTQFYSVDRPELANGLIPTTFKAPAASIYGRISDGLRYQLQVSTSVEDFGDSFDLRTDGNRVARFPTPYAAGINGLDALALSRPVLGDFRQLNNDVAVTGRLDYTPSFVPGLAGSTSVYFTPNTTPRGAHSDTGPRLGQSSLTLLDSELRYRVPNTGFELRGEYVQAFFGSPGNLRANNDSDPANNVGSTMFGYSGEIAYHQPLGHILGSDWEAVPFYRYTGEHLQNGGFAGTDPNQPTGAGHLQFHTAGVAVFPSQKVVLKASYQKVLSDQPGGPKSDSVLGAVGFFF